MCTQYIKHKMKIEKKNKKAEKEGQQEKVIKKKERERDKYVSVNT